MWLPRQLPAQAKTLNNLGLEVPAEDFANPKAAPLAAAVSLGGCSASFVSPDGLIVTNHHCVTGILQYNSTPKENYVSDGYSAKDSASELWAGPTQKAYVVQRITDVTNKMRSGLDAIKDPEARYLAAEKREKEIVASCEKGKPDIRCSVASFFGGAEFHLVERLQIRDVRLVFAPPEGVGNYGGDIDNWMWPRHTGDFSFLRAYVGPNGKPADYSKKNIPFKPPHHLAVSTEGVSKDSLVFVMGYPGRTSRLATAKTAKNSVDWLYPRSIKQFDEYLAVIDEATKDNPARRLVATPWIRGLNNYKKKYQGMLEGLEKGGLLEQRTRAEAELADAVAANPKLASIGASISKMDELQDKRAKRREHDAALGEIARYSRLLSVAETIVHVAMERKKPDADRAPEVQKRNWKRIEASFNSLDRRYDRELDKALLSTAIRRALRLPEADRPQVVSAFTKGGVDEASVAATLAKMYKKTSLENAKQRIKLLRTAKESTLKRSKDPFIQAAFLLRKELAEREKADDAYQGEMLLLRPEYIKGLRRSGKPISPDANSTLRVTYGTVKGYAPSPRDDVYTPFTYASQIVKKHTGESPFNAPKKVVAAINSKNYGRYAENGKLPVDFLSNTDITNGNSGSPTLNAKGELVGLAFDGNYEAMASDWLFMPAVTRTINTDIRYVLWTLDVLGGDRVLTELGIEPAIP